MWELSLDKEVKFEQFKKALEELYDLRGDKIIEYKDFWDLDDLAGLFGLKLAPGGRSYPTFATIYEAVDLQRNLPEIATRFSSYFGCRSLIGWEENRGRGTVGRFLEFHPDKRVFEGYVGKSDSDDDFRIDIVRELARDEIETLLLDASKISVELG